ncbi:GNAT family N-acetyltransferase [Fournierella massiliensis]|nr:GNAT family N-acetyltransferase [Fournierella massiliensis]MCF2556758.1 GNAT family N-acetyltransferase [Fournierella massiliensis]
MEDFRIETGRLVITPLTQEDKEACVDLALEGTIFELLGSETLARTARAAAWREIGAPGNLNGVLRLHTGEFCGRVCIQQTRDLPELGIALAASFRGQGLGPEAIRAFGDWYGKSRGAKQLRVRIRPDNAHSLRVFQKLGALPDPCPPPVCRQPGQPEPEPSLCFLLSLAP